MPNHRRRRDEQRGAVAVEMALVLIPLLIIVFGVIDFAAAYNAQIQLNQAAQAGARMATIDPTQVQNRVTAASPNLFGGVAPAVAATSCPAGGGGTASVRVSWTYNLLVQIPLLPVNSINMSQTAVMPCTK